MCRTNNSATQIRGQGHTTRSWDLPMKFMSFKSPQPFVRFSLNITQKFLSVNLCAEPITQLYKLKGHTSRSLDSAVGDMAVLQTAVLFLLFYAPQRHTFVRSIAQKPSEIRDINTKLQW